MLKSHYVETPRQKLVLKNGPRGIPVLHLPDGTPLSNQMSVNICYSNNDSPTVTVVFHIDGDNVRQE